MASRSVAVQGFLRKLCQDLGKFLCVFQLYFLSVDFVPSLSPLQARKTAPADLGISIFRGWVSVHLVSTEALEGAYWQGELFLSAWPRPVFCTGAGQEVHCVGSMDIKGHRKGDGPWSTVLTPDPL